MTDKLPKEYILARTKLEPDVLDAANLSEDKLTENFNFLADADRWKKVLTAPALAVSAAASYAFFTLDLEPAGWRQLGLVMTSYVGLLTAMTVGSRSENRAEIVRKSIEKQAMSNMLDKRKPHSSAP